MKVRNQNLLGPAVIGGVFGLLAGAAVFGFTLEYGPNIHPSWQPLWLYALLEASAVFGVVLLSTVLLLGFLPNWVRRK
jgi:hypothetical protein